MIKKFAYFRLLTSLTKVIIELKHLFRPNGPELSIESVKIEPSWFAGEGKSILTSSTVVGSLPRPLIGAKSIIFRGKMILVGGSVSLNGSNSKAVVFDPEADSVSALPPELALNFGNVTLAFFEGINEIILNQWWAY